MEAETSKFHTALINHEPPAPPENIDQVRKLYAQATLGAKPLALDTIKKIEQLREVKRQIKELEEKETELTKSIMEVLQEHEAGIDDTGKVLVEWKNYTRTEFDTKRFKVEHPDIYQKYAVEKISRTFRIKNQ
jgi:predicted phage-related endonuclease